MATQAEENAQEMMNWHWRNTMRPVRFFNLDARAVLPFCLLLLRLTSGILWSIAALSTFVFWVLEKRGLTFAAALRTLRRWIIGDRRPAYLPFRYRRMRDYG